MIEKQKQLAGMIRSKVIEKEPELEDTEIVDDIEMDDEDGTDLGEE